MSDKKITCVQALLYLLQKSTKYIASTLLPDFDVERNQRVLAKVAEKWESVSWDMQIPTVDFEACVWFLENREKLRILLDAVQSTVELENGEE